MNKYMYVNVKRFTFTCRMFYVILCTHQVDAKCKEGGTRKRIKRVKNDEHD